MLTSYWSKLKSVGLLGLIVYIVIHLFIFSVIALMVSGCGNTPVQSGMNVVEAKGMQVIKQDTPITYEYVGKVEAKNEAKIKSKVSGKIVKKNGDWWCDGKRGATIISD